MSKILLLDITPKFAEKKPEMIFSCATMQDAQNDGFESIVKQFREHTGDKADEMERIVSAVLSICVLKTCTKCSNFTKCSPLVKLCSSGIMRNYLCEDLFESCLAQYQEMFDASANQD